MKLYNRPQWSRIINIADGERGILQTVSMMREIVGQYKTDAEVRGQALALVAHLPQKDEYGEIEAVFNFVRDHIRYVKDVYDVETIHTPDKMLEIQQGDCDDKCVLLASLLESIGYQTMFKVTGYDGPDFQHVYVFASGLTCAMHLDPTEPESAGWEAPNPTNFLYVH